MSALNGTLALVEVNHIALAVAQHLNFDVARLQHVFLDEHAVVAKAVARFVAAAGETLQRFLVVGRHAQALAATTRRGLDHHRVTDVTGDLHCALGRFDGVVPTGNGVHFGFKRQLFRRDLVAHGRNRMRLGTDEGNAFVFATPGEGLVLTQEAVARVNGLGAGLFGGCDDLVGHQIRLARWRRADQHGLIGQAHVARVFVSFGVHGHGFDAHLLGGGDDAAGDLASVGDQDFGEHVVPLFSLT